MSDDDYEAMQDAKDRNYWQQADERDEWLETMNANHDNAKDELQK